MDQEQSSRFRHFGAVDNSIISPWRRSRANRFKPIKHIGPAFHSFHSFHETHEVWPCP
jgi:hypothetical protein